MIKEDIALRLIEHGWYQGSVITEDDLPALPNDSLGIVATHSCDLRHQSNEAEPFAEIAIAHRTDRSDGNLMYAKNSRALHLWIDCPREENGGRYVECRAHEKLSIPREDLAGIRPVLDKIVNPANCEIFRRWLANRYSRAALPDEFNKRVSVVEKKLRRVAKQVNRYVSAVYISVSPFDELSNTDLYSVQLVAAVPVDHGAEEEFVQQGMETLKELLGQQNIEVAAALAIREDVLTLDVIRGMERMPFEDLTHRDETAPGPEDS